MFISGNLFESKTKVWKTYPLPWFWPNPPWKGFDLFSHCMREFAFRICMHTRQNLLSISSNALRTCLSRYHFDVSFENLHRNCKKSTPKQIALYLSSLKLHKIVNDNLDDITFEQVTVFDQIRCSTRQLTFELVRNNTYKIGMNTTSNKLYALSKLVGLEMLHLSYIFLWLSPKCANHWDLFGSYWYTPAGICFCFCLFVIPKI